MTSKEIKKLVTTINNRQGESATLIETHISWVIITLKFAYKIKKPIKYSFLDYSGLEKRRFYCLKELILNRRITSGVYLEVVPVFLANDHFQLHPKEGKIVDYAVKMTKLEEQKLMIYLLEKKEVTKKHIETLAIKVATFHHHSDIIHSAFDWRNFNLKFSDIKSVKNFIVKELGSDMDEMITGALQKSIDFLRENANLVNSRVKNGFQRDVHGDLHAKNIFLYRDPIIFDCIEFNDEYRQMDILNEIAFCCMDLEANQRDDLSERFLHYYLKEFNAIRTSAEMNLFIYFKAYRANVRAKVHALRAEQETDRKVVAENIVQIEKYLRLMNTYLQEI